MSRYLLCVVVLAASADAQQVPVVPCGNSSGGGTKWCVGTAGQDVNLGGTVLETRVADAGLAILAPVVVGAAIVVEGTASTGTPANPPIIIRNRSKLDGGTILSVRHGATEAFAVGPSGITVGNFVGTQTIARLIVTSDAGIGGNLTVTGNELVGGTLGVTGLTSTTRIANASDAGFGGNVSIGGTLSLTGNKGTCNLDGGSPSQCDILLMPASSTCGCFGKGAVAATAVGVAWSLTSTTLTCTAANGLTSDVSGFCF